MSAPTGKEDVTDHLRKLTDLLQTSRADCEDARRVQEERERDKAARREEKDKQLAQFRSQLLQLKSGCEENKKVAGSTLATTSSSDELLETSSRLMEETVEHLRTESGNLLRSFRDDLRKRNEEHLESVIASVQSSRDSAVS